MQNQDDRYARVLKFYNDQVETTEKEWKRLNELYDTCDDEDVCSDMYESLLFAEGDYRDAAAVRDQILAIE